MQLRVRGSRWRKNFLYQVCVAGKTRGSVTSRIERVTSLRRALGWIFTASAVWAYSPRMSRTTIGRKAFKGRGALSNPAGRFEHQNLEAVDDGWYVEEQPDSIATKSEIKGMTPSRISAGIQAPT